LNLKVEQTIFAVSRSASGVCIECSNGVIHADRLVIAVASIDKIKAGNGRNNTYHAGAYLYNGLHEGAIQSALAIKSQFGL
jgi:predicted NAD/FAD-binding protein